MVSADRDFVTTLRNPKVTLDTLSQNLCGMQVLQCQRKRKYIHDRVPVYFAVGLEATSIRALT